MDQGLAWITQGTELQQRERAGVKALYSMLAATTCGRAKELVKQGVDDRNGMVTFGRIRERCGKTAGVAKLTEGFSSSSGTPTRRCGETSVARAREGYGGALAHGDRETSGDPGTILEQNDEGFHPSALRRTT